MSAATIIGQVRASGGQITVDGSNLVLTAPQPLPDDLLDEIKASKADVIAELSRGWIDPIEKGLRAGIPIPSKLEEGAINAFMEAWFPFGSDDEDDPAFWERALKNEAEAFWERCVLDIHFRREILRLIRSPVDKYTA